MWIYIVRHAETNGNRDRIVQTPDTPLSDRGYQQAKCFGSAYQHLTNVRIFCSDYQRAQSTAAELHKRLDCSIAYSELLRERNFGSLRGKSHDDIKENFFAKDYHPPGGESYLQFRQRVANAWQQIVSLSNEENGDLVVVTHGLVVRCLLSEVLGLSPDIVEQTNIENTCVTKISRIDHTHIPILCDASHLNNSLLNENATGAA